MSPGAMIPSGSDETEQGIEKKVALHYYARWKLLRDLLPAVVKAKNKEEQRI